MQEIEQFSAIQSRSSVDYLLRTQHQNSVLLIQIADQKANILIGVAVICLTLIFTRFDLDQLPLPVLAISITAAAASLLSLLTLIPRSSKPVPSITEDGMPLLHFSRATALPRQEYLRKMSSLLEDDALIYHQLTADLYGLNKVLSYKYRLLGISYFVLAAGLVISCVIALFYYSSGAV